MPITDSGLPSPSASIATLYELISRSNLWRRLSGNQARNPIAWLTLQRLYYRPVMVGEMKMRSTKACSMARAKSLDIRAFTT